MDAGGVRGVGNRIRGGRGAHEARTRTGEKLDAPMPGREERGRATAQRSRDSWAIGDRPANPPGARPRGRAGSSRSPFRWIVLAPSGASLDMKNKEGR
jgi:hypothetical protein